MQHFSGDQHDFLPPNPGPTVSTSSSPSLARSAVSVSSWISQAPTPDRINKRYSVTRSPSGDLIWYPECGTAELDHALIYAFPEYKTRVDRMRMALLQAGILESATNPTDSLNIQVPSDVQYRFESVPQVLQSPPDFHQAPVMFGPEQPSQVMATSEPPARRGRKRTACEFHRRRHESCPLAQLDHHGHTELFSPQSIPYCAEISAPHGPQTQTGTAADYINSSLTSQVPAFLPDMATVSGMPHGQAPIVQISTTDSFTNQGGFASFYPPNMTLSPSSLGFGQVVGDCQDNTASWHIQQSGPYPGWPAINTGASSTQHMHNDQTGGSGARGASKPCVQRAQLSSKVKAASKYILKFFRPRL